MAEGYERGHTATGTALNAEICNSDPLQILFISGTKDAKQKPLGCEIFGSGFRLRIWSSRFWDENATQRGDTFHYEAEKSNLIQPRTLSVLS